MVSYIARLQDVMFAMLPDQNWNSLRFKVWLGEQAVKQIDDRLYESGH